MERNELIKILVDLENLGLPSKKNLNLLFEQVLDILHHEENIIYVNGSTHVVGDLHGHYFDFLNMLEKMENSKDIVFLGDYVDRGYNSVELMIHLIVLKVLYSKSIYLLRGNHENPAQTSVYGFQEECCNKYDLVVYWKFCEVFKTLPMAAIVNSTYFLVHGGIMPGLTLDWIKSRDRVVEFSEISLITWADPTNMTEEFDKSPRGAGYVFGKNALNAFLENIQCKYLVRSHQLVLSGVDEHFDGKCITIWSAPNYCYKCNNKAAFMTISNDNTHKYTFFNAVENQFYVDINNNSDDILEDYDIAI